MAYPGFQRGGQARYEKGGVLSVSGSIRKAGGGRCASGPIRKARGEGGGVLSVSGPIRKVGGGGGGGCWCCQLLAQYEKGGAGAMCWRGAEELARIFLATTPILVFIFETEMEGGARAP